MTEASQARVQIQRDRMDSLCALRRELTEAEAREVMELKKLEMARDRVRRRRSAIA